MTTKEFLDILYDLEVDKSLGPGRLDLSKRAHQATGVLPKHKGIVYPEEAALFLINTVCIQNMKQAPLKIGEYKYRLSSHTSTLHALTHLLEDLEESTKVNGIEIGGENGQSTIFSIDEGYFHFGGIDPDFKQTPVMTNVMFSMEFLHALAIEFYNHDKLESEERQDYINTYFKGKDYRKFIRKDLKYRLPHKIEDWPND